MTDQEISELEKLCEKATPGEWSLWTSCSWRRIGIDHPQQTVIEPTIASDGHPDLHARKEDLEFACASRQAIPALIADWRKKEAALVAADEMEEFLSARASEIAWKLSDDYRAKRKAMEAKP